MDPHTATELQIARYRGMTGEQRLAIALRLHDLACDLARAGIRASFPDASDEEVERRLRKRIRLTYRVNQPVNE
jgi:hypothetical protein